MAVQITGMFGNDKTYFANNPVVITVSGLDFPVSSPIKVVRVLVMYNNTTVGRFVGDVAGTAPYSIDFEISSALRTIWADYNSFTPELEAATDAIAGDEGAVQRVMREYSLQVLTEYIASDGAFTQTDSGTFAGGRCVIGGRTEWERSLLADVSQADISTLDNTNPRNGDASTKPTTSPERVGKDSITSFVDFADVNPNPQQSVVVTRATYYPSSAEPSADSTSPHAPLVLREDEPYVDFLFVNRRGALETCSAKMLESMDINIESKTYSMEGKPSYIPKRSLMTIANGGGKSWSMSSGYQTREWAEWWATEFLMSRSVWMRYPFEGNSQRFVPVTISPAKKAINIYNRVKQDMPSVEFSVTPAL